MSTVLFSNESSSLWCIENYADIPMNVLKELPLMQRPEIVVYGRICHQKRNVGFFSDVTKSYPYSGRAAPAVPLTLELKAIMEQVNRDFSYDFNSVLVNHYSSGEDVIGAHSDNEATLSSGVVAGIAFGVERIFRIREKSSKKIVYDHHRKPKSLVVMDGKFQQQFTHEIPVQKKVVEKRISLTFRKHKA